MASRSFEFAFGETHLTLGLPEERILQVVEGRAVAPIADVAAAVREALRQPIGSAPLRQVVRPGEKVAIIVSDVTRAWVGTDQLLPTILDELNEAGVPDRDLSLVVAQGTHRPHTAAEDVAAFGQAVCRRVAIHQHDALDRAGLVRVGVTSRGVEVVVNRRVVEADRLILTGGIAYHLMAGFGGGRKSVLPGVSAFDTIQANHRLCMHPVPGRGVNPACASGALDGNPMHEDAAEATALVAPDFLVNVVRSADGALAGVVAGHWDRAWRAGTARVESILGVPIAARADLVVASAGGFPKDINLYQGCKTIDSVRRAVKPGGVIVCALECREIGEPAEFAGWFEYADDLRRFEDALRGAFTVAGFSAYTIAQTAREHTLIVVTRPENAPFLRRIGIVPATSLEEALRLAAPHLPPGYTIHVMPHAAATVPILGA